MSDVTHPTTSQQSHSDHPRALTGAVPTGIRGHCVGHEHSDGAGREKKEKEEQKKDSGGFLPVYFSLRDWTQLMEGEVVSD